jgi:hypothetical protein
MFENPTEKLINHIKRQLWLFWNRDESISIIDDMGEFFIRPSDKEFNQDTLLDLEPAISSSLERYEYCPKEICTFLGFLYCKGFTASEGTLHYIPNLEIELIWRLLLNKMVPNTFPIDKIYTFHKESIKKMLKDAGILD